MLVKVGVVGYGVIGLRLAEGVALKDMELVGVADVGPLSVRAWRAGYAYDFTWPYPKTGQLEAVGVKVSGTLEDLVEKCDVILDATSAGVGQKNRPSTRSTVRKPSSRRRKHRCSGRLLPWIRQLRRGWANSSSNSLLATPPG